MKYVVIVTYSFDPDVLVYPFDDFNKAQEYLHDLWQYAYNEEEAIGMLTMNELETYHEDNFAQIKWADDSFTWYQLAPVSEPIKFNKKDCR